MSDETWKLATGYATPHEANAAFLEQAEIIRVLADALVTVREHDREGRALTLRERMAIDVSLRLAGRLK